MSQHYCRMVLLWPLFQVVDECLFLIPEVYWSVHALFLEDYAQDTAVKDINKKLEKKSIQNQTTVSSSLTNRRKGQELKLNTFYKNRTNFPPFIQNREFSMEFLNNLISENCYNLMIKCTKILLENSRSRKMIQIDIWFK